MPGRSTGERRIMQELLEHLAVFVRSLPTRVFVSNTL